MKQVISALAASVAIAASAAQYVTVQDCTRGESGMDCQTITYQVRPASPATAQSVNLIPVGDQGGAVIPQVHGGWLLKALQDLNAKGAKRPMPNQFPMVNGG